MAAADLDNNGNLEVIVVDYLVAGGLTTGAIHVFQPAGSERPGWPVATPYNQEIIAVADLNRDGHKEIAFSMGPELHVLNGGGQQYSPTWPVSGSRAIIQQQLVVGDIDGDGFPEIVTTGVSWTPSSDGISRPVQTLLAFTGEGVTEIAVASGSQESHSSARARHLRAGTRRPWFALHP